MNGAWAVSLAAGQVHPSGLLMNCPIITKYVLLTMGEALLLWLQTPKHNKAIRGLVLKFRTPLRHHSYDAVVCLCINTGQGKISASYGALIRTATLWVLFPQNGHARKFKPLPMEVVCTFSEGCYTARQCVWLTLDCTLLTHISPPFPSPPSYQPLTVTISICNPTPYPVYVGSLGTLWPTIDHSKL